jgi:flagellar motor switch protein FliG
MEEGIRAIKEPDEKQLKKILKTQEFIDNAKEMIGKNIEELGEIRDYEIKFYF